MGCTTVICFLVQKNKQKASEKMRVASFILLIKESKTLLYPTLCGQWSYTGISSVVSVVRVAPYMGILYTADCKHAMGNTCI